MSEGITRGRELAESGKHAPPNGFDDIPPPDEPPDDDGTRCADLLDGLVTAAELHHEVFPDLVQFVPGLVQEGFGIVAGPPKLGKSWWTLNLALAVAAGGRAFGKIPVAQRPVLLLALEDSPRRLQSRIRAVWGDGLPPNGLHIMTAVQPGQLIPTVTAWLEGNPGGLVVLDTLGRARPQRRRGDDPYIADYQAGVALKTVVDQFPGSALLGVHHTRKASSDDFVDDLSGTLGLAGSADYVLVLRRPRGSDEATLQVTGRDAPEGEYAFTTTDGAWTLCGDGLAEAAAEAHTRRETKNLGRRSRDALTFVNSQESTTPAELAKHLGIDNKLAGNVLAKLFAAGRINKPCHGLYARVGGETGETDETDESEFVTEGSKLLVDVSPDSPVSPVTHTCPCGAALERPESVAAGTCAECRTERGL